MDKPDVPYLSESFTTCANTGSSEWQTKSPEQVLADIRAAFETLRAMPEPVFTITLMVYEPDTDTVRKGTPEDFDWFLLCGELVPRPKPPLQWAPLPRG